MLAGDIYLVFFFVWCSISVDGLQTDRIKEGKLTNCFVSLCTLVDFGISGTY